MTVSRLEMSCRVASSCCWRSVIMALMLWALSSIAQWLGLEKVVREYEVSMSGIW
jgi:hypothetical protein